MKGLIFLIIIVVIIVGGLFLIYFYYEKPQQQNHKLNYVNLSISAQHNKKKVTTEYIIELPNLIRQGNTSKLGYTLEKLPANLTIKIYNKNLPSQNYYTDLQELKIIKGTNYRIDLNLEEPKKLNITLLNKTQDKITLNLFSENFKNVKFCIGYSPNILFVKANYEKIEKIASYRNYSRCYYTNYTLKNENKEVTLTYLAYGVLQDDYIKVIFIDSDYLDGSFRTGEKTDLFGKNEEITINL